MLFRSGILSAGYRAERMPANPAGDTGLRPVKLRSRAASPVRGRTAILTGEYAAPVLSELVAGSDVLVIPVRNDFFGGNTAVAGLMVGEDIARVMRDHPDIDDFLLPDVCLSEGRFLDGTTPADLPGNVTVVPTDGVALRRILERSP